MSPVDRRRFLGAAALAGMAGPAAFAAQADRAGSEQPFSFLLFGDTHFDRLEHHDFEWMKQAYENDIRQVRDYSQRTLQTLPALFAAAAKRIEKSTPAVAFAAHLGDAVEGLCGSPELALRQSREFFEFYQQQGLGVPLVVTKGNHDITGPGAKEAYQDVFLGHIGRQLGRKIPSASFTIEKGNALLAFFDAYDSDAIDWLDPVLEKRTARHLFVLLHPPVVPYNARSSWHALSHPRLSEKRERLVELLGRHRAIVLSGHLHKYSLLVRRTTGGRFVQLGLCSVLDAEDHPVRGYLEGTARYGAELVDLEPDFDPKSRETRQAILQREKPFIERFEYAETAGFAMLRVEPDRVVAEIHTGTRQRPWKTLDLTKLLQERTP